MNPTLFVSALRQRFTSRIRLVMLSAVFGVPVLITLMSRRPVPDALNTSVIFAFILGAGIIGQESSSGVMQLLFARPVRRRDYVMSRWLAVVAASSALSLIQIACVGAIGMLFRSGVGPADLVAVAAQQIVNAFGMASVILLFSSFVTGIGDVVAVLIAQVVGQAVIFFGQLKGGPVAIRAGEEIQRFVGASVPLDVAFKTHRVPWFDLVSYLSTIALCLCIAIVVINRREISYASD
jgi:ABC-type transport system involved in multi-copper enzyme maturation permease subunit